MKCHSLFNCELIVTSLALAFRPQVQTAPTGEEVSAGTGAIA